MTARSRKRPVLPTRPEPPSVSEALADVSGASAGDPVFSSPAEGGAEFRAPGRTEELMPDLETQYQQSRSYVELNRRLQEERNVLAARCEALRKAGEELDLSISEIKDKAFQN
ncbi:UPF0449 protein C19orf25 homolog [Callorhinchus milii]|uniref:UPF0449 protein C19orf25 homolog n=1 Tax=Callorhinchus milii TaxID=7868 RepID=UPI00045735E5|nr:UPF0449 protein C19orf25 homolog [Callorhinchus milii]|eukprot:gi/632961725/ref/XP_007896920.1/ PREDICTED: UPF0449 protein C19orf25 homolog [Callorhinchus milii]